MFLFTIVLIIVLLSLTVYTGGGVHALVNLLLLVWIIVSRRRYTPDKRLLSAMIGAIILNLIGAVLNLYRFIGVFDQISHLFTVAAVVILVHLSIKNSLTTTRPLGYFLLLIAIGTAFGAWWEIVEWWLDQILRHNLIEGAADTAYDLIADTLGAALAALYISRFKK